MPGHIPALKIAAIWVALGVAPATGRADMGDWAVTLYGGRVSSQPGWEDIIIDAPGTRFVDAYLAAGAVSREYAQVREGDLVFEWEGQVVYHFGDQSYWELNAVPVVVRWRSFPWSSRVATTAAFGLGLSWATQLPQIEVELEGESRQLLVYWFMELTAGLPDSPWAVSLRIHHRSVAFGLMGEDGGMNAVGLGLRYQF